MTDDRCAGRPRGARLAMVALIGALVSLVAPGAALAQDDQIRLALLPVGQAGSFFDLTMTPGETRNLDVEIANNGSAALAVRTYAADVYTIVNGGFGGRLRGEPQTGMTRWLSYPTDVLQLQAGKSTRRSLTVAVPAGAGPGEYIASIILENDQPILVTGAAALNQIVRQAIAVVVTVPGLRSPAMAIGGANHKIVAGRSIVAVAVENTGNVRLKPLATFILTDAAGAQISKASVQMDTFYANTNTIIEVPLEALLRPGTYTVRLTLEDAAQGAVMDKGAIPLVVDAPPLTAPVAGVAPGLTAVAQGSGEGRISLPVWAIVLVAGLALGGVVIGSLTVALRRRRRTSVSDR